MSLDEDITIGCAFRYALGRQTYVVDSVCSEIERRVSDISVKTRRRFIGEINEAIAEKRAGMQMDVDRWLKCRHVIGLSLEAERVGSGTPQPSEHSGSQRTSNTQAQSGSGDTQ